MRVNSTPLSPPLAQMDMWAVAPKLKGRQPYPCVRCGTVVMRWPSVAAKRRVFCTLDCANSGGFAQQVFRKGQEHPCEKCGKLVWRKPSDRDARHQRVICGPGCWSNRVERPCGYCGEPVTRAVSQVVSERIFCNRKCAGAFHAQRERPARVRVEAFCAMCRTPKWVVPSAIKSRNFCGLTCLGKWRSTFLSRNPIKPKSPRSVKTTKISKPCVDCSKVFFTSPSHAVDLIRCQECRGGNRWGNKGARRREVLCAFCGAQFETKLARASKSEKMFCNRKCQGQWASANKIGSGHPQWKGGRSANRARQEANPRYRLKRRVSNGIWWSIKGQKNNRHWEDLVGYALDDLMAHLEPLFKPGMSWENYGKWHIDHIRPVSSFSFAVPEDPEFLQCWALSNLQPLWAIDNLRKGGRLLDDSV